jgi:RNA-directed DNA polymerase
VARFDLDAEHAILALQAQLRRGVWRPGPFRHFVIHDRKRRLISAAPFADRVVHHALMSVLEPWLDARFIPDCYACRPGRGTHRAVLRYQHWAARSTYVLKLDIRRYFPSIRHDVLAAQLERRIGDADLLACLLHIVRHGHGSLGTPGLGLPIGNLTSQILANLYLDDLDHRIEQGRADGLTGYLRYVDDLCLLARDKAVLHYWHGVIERELGALGLALHPRKQLLQPVRRPLDLLGYRVTAHRRRVRPDNVHRARRRLQALARAYGAGHLTLDQVRQRLHAWLGHARFAMKERALDELLGQVRFVPGAAPG